MAPYLPLPILHCKFQQPSQPSHYKCTIPVTIHCKFKRPMVTHQNRHPSLITASELNNRTNTIEFNASTSAASTGATSSLTDGVTRPCMQGCLHMQGSIAMMPVEMPAVTLQAIKQSPNFWGSHELHAQNVHPPLSKQYQWNH